MSDNCYKCKLRTNCMAVFLEKREEVGHCENYEYDREFFQMEEDFPIQLLKMMYGDATGRVLILCNRDLSIFTKTKVTPDLQELMGDNLQIYVKGYVDKLDNIRIVGRINLSNKW